MTDFLRTLTAFPLEHPNWMLAALAVIFCVAIGRCLAKADS